MTITTAQHVPIPDRLEHFRRRIAPMDRVLEIGPSHAPLAAKSDGYDTLIVDHATREDLQQKYTGHGVDIDRIEHVDRVWTSGSLLDSVGREATGTFDVAIASHVIEHLPDPISFLTSVSALLKPSGKLLLAVPDKRYCFDLFRPISTTASWLEALDRGGSIHSRSTAFEHTSYAVSEHGKIGWGHMPLTDLGPADAGIQRGYDLFREIGHQTSGPYLDFHAWTFTPSSFTLIMYELHALGLVELLPTMVLNLQASEFWTDLSMESREPITPAERMALLRASGVEQAVGFSQLT